MSAVASKELKEKITEYGSFISQTLQPQLKTAVDAREETEKEISEYVHLKNRIQFLLNEWDGSDLDRGDGRHTETKKFDKGEPNNNQIIDEKHGDGSNRNNDDRASPVSPTAPTSHSKNNPPDNSNQRNENNSTSKSSKKFKPLKLFTDICHSTIYCQATIPNPRTIYVHIGFGFHAEFTLEEAIQFVDRRLRYLEKEVLVHRIEVARGVAADVERALELLEELGGEMEGLERETD
mmetsp:Transcript_1563/g.3365  ORF Transcript_1563/g.3365 Transcript_1563/m.3365 type:complete len:236 (-) Transcript_1563:153-860(-)